MGFVLVVMACSGHVNAECYWSFENFPNRSACVEAMSRSREWTGFFGAEFKQREFHPRQVMCLASELVSYPSEGLE